MIETLTKKLNNKFPSAKVKLESDDEVHFNLTIVDEVFEKLNLLARHRMVYDAIESDLMKKIHALSIKAITPNESN
jgi:stress-induced morphogen